MAFTLISNRFKVFACSKLSLTYHLSHDFVSTLQQNEASPQVPPEAVTPDASGERRGHDIFAVF